LDGVSEDKYETIEEVQDALRTAVRCLTPLPLLLPTLGEQLAS
jgi:hypothetical protein